MIQEQPVIVENQPSSDPIQEAQLTFEDNLRAQRQEIQEIQKQEAARLKEFESPPLSVE